MKADPEEATERFEEIRAQLIKTETIARYGRDSKASVKNIQDLENYLSIEAHSASIDPLVGLIRSAVEKIRAEERNIMKLCIRYARMPRKEFIKSFPGNEVNLKWTGSLVESNADYHRHCQPGSCDFALSAQVSSGKPTVDYQSSRLKTLIAV